MCNYWNRELCEKIPEFSREYLNALYSPFIQTYCKKKTVRNNRDQNTRAIGRIFIQKHL